MSTDTLIRLPFDDLPDADRPWYADLMTIDDKIVGKGVEVTLMRSKGKDWSGQHADFRHKFYVCVDVPGEDQLRFIGGTDRDFSLGAAIIAYDACTDNRLR